MRFYLDLVWILLQAAIWCSNRARRWVLLRTACEFGPARTARAAQGQASPISVFAPSIAARANAAGALRFPARRGAASRFDDEPAAAGERAEALARDDRARRRRPGRVQLQRFGAAQRVSVRLQSGGGGSDGLSRLGIARRHLRLDRAAAAAIAERDFERRARVPASGLAAARLHEIGRAAGRRRTPGR